LIEFVDWGLIDYQQALERQEALVEKAQSTLVFCTHPPIVTLGRKTQSTDIFDWQGPIKEISRGGRATYHGPSQLVVYPIINLAPKNDVNKHLRTIENAIIDTLKEYNIIAQAKAGADFTGVWVGEQKIASVGVAVRRWMTYHGAAINLDEDPKAFWGMNPCGFSREIMTSLEKLTGSRVDRRHFEDLLKVRLLEMLV
jgi:lipoyl(octanoyl) transferase